MKYKCGHNGCDICGGRECDQRKLRDVGDFWVCEPCIRMAIRTVYELACKLGGIIDLEKECGYASDESPKRAQQ